MLTKLALGNTYKANHDDGNFVSFFDWLRVICYKSDDIDLSPSPLQNCYYN